MQAELARLGELAEADAEGDELVAFCLGAGVLAYMVLSSFFLFSDTLVHGRGAC